MRSANTRPICLRRNAENLVLGGMPFKIFATRFQAGGRITQLAQKSCAKCLQQGRSDSLTQRQPHVRFRRKAARPGSPDCCALLLANVRRGETAAGCASDRRLPTPGAEPAQKPAVSFAAW